MDLVNESISWLQNGEPVTGGVSGDSAGVLNRPLVQLLANDNGLQDRIDIFADDDGYIKKLISSIKITESGSGTTARVQIDAAGLKQYDGTNLCADFDESGNITLGYGTNDKITLASGVLTLKANELDISGAGNSGISLNNATGDGLSIAGAGANAIEVEAATQYGLKLGNNTSGYGPLHIVNAGVTGASNLHSTYGSAEMDTLAIDDQHDLYIKTGASTWQKVGATASPVAVVDTAIITGTATTDNSVVMDANGLTMRKSAGAVRFDVNEDGSWTLGNAAGERIDFTTGDALSFVNGTLTSPKINEAVALNATATELNVLDGISATLSPADLSAVENFEETVSATTSEVSVLASKNLNVVGHDGVTYGLKLNSVLVTATAAELNALDGITADASDLNQLDGVTVGGTSAGDIATIDDTQIFTNKSISGEQIDSGTVAAARIADLSGTYSTVGHTHSFSTITSGDIGTNYLEFSGSSYATRLFNNSTGAIAYLQPQTNNAVDLYIGDGSNFYKNIVLQGVNGVSINAYEDANNFAQIECYTADTVERINLRIKEAGVDRSYYVTHSSIYPNTTDVCDLGGTSNKFKDIYSNRSRFEGSTLVANADKVELFGSSYHTNLWCNTDGSQSHFDPGVGGGVQDLYIGYSTTNWNLIYLNASSNITLFAGAGSNGAVVCDSSADALRPYLDTEATDLGTSANGWDVVYRVSEAAPAEMYYMDGVKDKKSGKVYYIDDLEALLNIKPRLDEEGNPIYDEETGFMLVDDTSLPNWLFKKDKDDKVEKNKKGQSFYHVDAMTQLNSGAIRQLAARIQQLEEELDTLKEV